MIFRITRLALSIGLTLSLGVAAMPLGCGGSEEVTSAPVRPSRKAPQVPEQVVEQLTDCANQVPARFSSAEPARHNIQFDVQVSKDGRAISVQIKDSTLGGDGVEACMAGVLQGMTLPLRAMAMESSEPVTQRSVSPQSRGLVAHPGALVSVALGPVLIAGAAFIVVVGKSGLA
jgi:hypothetical protein